MGEAAQVDDATDAGLTGLRRKIAGRGAVALLEVLNETHGVDQIVGRADAIDRGIGMGKEATLYLTRDHGVRVTGIDAWGWDAPFKFAKEEWLKHRDASKVWQGHWAGIEQPYCHMEKLLNLEQLPDTGFTVSCFPWKIKGASAGFIRAVALFD